MEEGNTRLMVRQQLFVRAIVDKAKLPFNWLNLDGLVKKTGKMDDYGPLQQADSPDVDGIVHNPRADAQKGPRHHALILRQEPVART